MKHRISGPVCIAATALLGIAVVARAQQGPGMMTPNQGGMGMGMMGRDHDGAGMGPGMMGGNWGSMPRHHYAMMYGVPKPYAGLRDPLPNDDATIARGAAVYRQNCALCHGPAGAGDGPAGRNLSPPPADLAWLAQMPMTQWDPYMFWAIAEGGSQFGSAMPAFKGTLAKDDIWAVIAYIRAGFPQR